MKRLLKRLSPFAPDHSGAVSVLFELGGLITLCDAGGCTGNVCGFDEPRWETANSAVFSAALRDMDAIMGRDDRLVTKLANAMQVTDLPFAALVGTPVPAVIGTDFIALRRMAERRTGKPVIALSAAGTGMYVKIFFSPHPPSAPRDKSAGSHIDILVWDMWPAISSTDDPPLQKILPSYAKFAIHYCNFTQNVLN